MEDMTIERKIAALKALRDQGIIPEDSELGQQLFGEEDVLTDIQDIEQTELEQKDLAKRKRFKQLADMLGEKAALKAIYQE